MPRQTLFLILYAFKMYTVAEFEKSPSDKWPAVTESLQTVLMPYWVVRI